MSIVELVEEAPTEPLSLSSAKSHLRLDDINDEDAAILSLITSARQIIERMINRDIVVKAWDYKLPRFPVGAIALPKAPVTSITSITYIDPDGTLQTLSDSLYDLYGDDTYADAGLAYDKQWPSTREQRDAVVVRFVTGYTSVPAPIVHAMKMIVADLDNYRSNTIATGAVPKEVNLSIKYLLAPYRRVRL